MRELKFRAFIKPLGRYATGIDTIQFHKCCDVAGAGIWTVVTANEGIFEFDDIIVEQYTGLKDKNGKEIYEGDILVSNVSTVYKVSYSEPNGRFEMWSEDGCGGKITDDQYTEEFDIKVIGNIHENPELLEEEG